MKQLLFTDKGGVIMGFEKCGCVESAGASRCQPGENSFLLLLLLFILLASCSTSGIESRFIFIIILAIIAFGGCGRAFGI